MFSTPRPFLEVAARSALAVAVETWVVRAVEETGLQHSKNMVV
jgi:hypothetical protein